MQNPRIKIERVLTIAVKLPGYEQRFREAGLCDRNGNIITDWQAAFQRLRPLEKKEVCQNPHLFLANASDVVYRGMTGGTRGKSLVYFAGEEWNHSRITARKKTLAWWGIDEDIPILNVGSRLFPVRWMDGSLVGEIHREFIDLFLHLLKSDFRVIRGYPSKLCEIAAYLFHVQLPQVKAVICTGECLYAYQISLLKSVFNAPVINEYGCQETGISSLTCPEKGCLYLDAERCFYEIVEGELVTTDLFNFTMPLIRYKCGDILEFNGERYECDRMDLTTKIKGRIEDKVRTLIGIKYAGEIELPPLEGILNYQIRRRKNKQVEFLLQPTDRDRIPLDGLKNWTDDIFGEIEAQIYTRSREIPETQYKSCSDREWLKIIRDRPWHEWLNSPQFPLGEAQKSAQLLYEFINPRLILYSGIAPSTLKLIYFIKNSSPYQDSEIEKITARILLFSCSFLADHSEAFSVYKSGAERLKRVIDRDKQSDDPALLDLLIPSLYLEEDLARSIWENFPLELNHDRIILDRFNIQNLLYSFETAWHLTNRKQSKIAKLIKPLLSLLMGDLEFFSSRFNLYLLSYWCNLVHGVEIINIGKNGNCDRFFASWLKWRKAMLENCGKIEQYFDELKSVAKTKDEKARILLEQGYHTLFLEREFKIREWLPILQKYAGLKQRNNLNFAIDSTPWIPILRSLAQPLLDSGKSELAYQCLLLSALPSSRQSVFDRRTKEVNEKQAVLCDLMNI
ncbi:MAG: hypothetical protein J7647_15920 [Cyanobacteria bacterium SBLK]|nr:hypothetical protein [Cyanobacteria bacterium SBLK]